MKTNRILEISLTCLCLAVGLSLSSTPRALAGAGTLHKMTTAYTTVGGIVTPFWMSYEKGLFQKYGLDMSLKFVSSGPVIVSAVVAGDIDITSTGPEQFVSAILEGADLTLIGFIATTTPLMLYTQPNITRLEQLKGGTAAVSRLTSSAAYMLKVGLRQAGLEAMKDVTVIQAGGIPEAFAALQAGKVQGAMLSPPTTYKAEAAGFKRLWSGLGVEFPSLVLGTRKSFLRTSEDVALRFLQATAEGIHLFKTDREEALKVMSKYTKVTERKVLEDTYNDNKDVHTVTLQPTVSGIKTILETLSVSNPKAATAKPEDFIDPRPLKKLEDSGFFKKLGGS
jgi:ABC-type nitrate/sulfonate/bicarbonate transport system substrate-binding protein